MTTGLALKPGTDLPGLRALRGIAALAIIAFHIAYLPRPSLTTPWVLERIIPNLFHGVTLFFVLSAFVLPHSTVPYLRTDRWLLRYAIRRFFRIAPLFYAMIAFYSLFYPPVSISLGAVAANLLFIFNFVPGLHSSIVWAGWTIGVEAPFYVILPAVLCRIRTQREAAWIFGASIVIAIVARLAIAGSGSPSSRLEIMSFASNLPAFAAGLMVWQCASTWSTTPHLGRLLGAVSVLTLAATLALPAREPLPQLPRPELDQLIWVVPMASLCTWQAVAPTRWLASQAMQWVGDRSFSCYLLHPPIVFLLASHGAYIAIQGGLDPVIGAWSYIVCVALTIPLVLVAATLSFHLIERPGQRVGILMIRPLLQLRIRPG